MEGLSNHIGKAEHLQLREEDENILSLISESINDGLLKIDKFIRSLGFERGDDNAYASITDWVNAISPSSIRELTLSVPDDVQHLDCDWSLLPQLQRLSLCDILVDFSITSPSSLKYMRMAFYSISMQANVLNTTMSFLPKLEELNIFQFYFDDQSFRNLLHTIKNKLPNLRRVNFHEVAFNLRNIDSMIKEFKYDFVLETLKELRFENCRRFENIIRLFLRVCSLDILYIGMNPADFNQYFGIYDLTSSIRENTKLELRLSFHAIETPYRCPNDSLPQFCPALTKFSVYGMNSRKYLREWFKDNSYEKLTELEFDRCDGLNDENLKIIAKTCPWLEKLIIDFDEGKKKIKENGMKSFLIYWPERRSKQLSIIIEGLEWASDSVSDIHGLFGTSLEKGRGILENRWMMEENENESPSKRRKTSMEEDGLRWMLYTKSLRNIMAIRLMRLVIWDERKNFDQKILVIKNYDKDIRLRHEINISI